MEMKKIIVLGERASGKSALIERLRSGNFLQDHVSTQDITNSIFDIEFKEDVPITYEFVEVPESELQNCPQDGDAYFVMVDTSESCPDFDIRTYLRYLPEDGMCMVLGNKEDLPRRKIVNGLDFSVRTCLGFTCLYENLQDI